MKRVLIVSFDFPPAGGTSVIRAAKFVKYLPQFGWQPLVVCSDTAWTADEHLLQDLPADLVVHRVKWPRLVRVFRPDLSFAASRGGASRQGPGPVASLSLLKQGAGRLVRRLLVPDPSVMWTLAARRACAEVLRERPCDVVLTTAPPHSMHLIGDWLHRRFGLPWLADCRDIWTVDNPTIHQMGRWHVARQRRLERHILEACDRVIVVSQAMQQHMLGTFGAGLFGKILTITNGFDGADFPGTERELDETFTIAYTGTILSTRSDNAFPEGLRLALAQSADLRDMARVRFFGQIAPEYRARFGGMENNVEFRGFVTHDTAIEALRQAHISLILLPETGEGRVMFTNKFFECLAARRPILAVVPDGVISEVVSENEIGEVVPPNDAPAISRAMLKMFDTLRARPNAYRMPDGLLARFERRELTRQLASALDDVAGNREQEPGAIVGQA